MSVAISGGLSRKPETPNRPELSGAQFVQEQRLKLQSTGAGESFSKLGAYPKPAQPDEQPLRIHASFSETPLLPRPFGTEFPKKGCCQVWECAEESFFKSAEDLQGNELVLRVFATRRTPHTVVVHPRNEATSVADVGRRLRPDGRCFGFQGVARRRCCRQPGPSSKQEHSGITVGNSFMAPGLHGQVPIH